MKASRFSEAQIIGILKEQEAGRKTVDVRGRHGASEATFYTWTAKYGGLEVSEDRRLKALGDETARLKKLLALRQGRNQRRSPDFVADSFSVPPRNPVGTDVGPSAASRTTAFPGTAR